MFWMKFRPGCRLLLSLNLGLSAAWGQDSPRLPGPPEVVSGRLFLRWERPDYTNYAFQPYTNYPNHAFPHEDSPRAFYSSLGDFLMRGYPLYEWSETRTPGQEFGSSIFKHSGQTLGAVGPWVPVFDSMVMARDGYGDWGYSAIVGDGLIGHFTPLTLSRVDVHGFRLDVALPHGRLTGLGSRIERPKVYTESPSPWALTNQHFADDSTLLLGSRVVGELGRLQVGLNWANIHVYQSTQPGNSLKGRLRPDQPLVDWIVVRFADDSPADGRGGAVVQGVKLIVNGRARPDLAPRVVRHRAGLTPQVGRVDRRTGEFRPINYQSTGGSRKFYRGRNEMPLFSDYFYRLDHEAGIDVGDVANIPGLVEGIAIISPEEIVRADGDAQVVFLFDLSQEPRVESVQVEALLGNDYLVEVAQLSQVYPTGRTYHAKFLSTFYRPVRRAPGNVQDQSNLERVRFDIGEDTGLFTYSADVQFQWPGLEIKAEYARSARYGRYPAQREGAPLFDVSPRFAERGSAYFVNATHWFGQGRIGGEYFAIHPDFRTDMRTFLDWEIGLGNTHLQLMRNQTVYWELVEDNDDGDRFPDRRLGNVPGFTNDNRDGDIDGVALAQDEDNDGFPETNRDGDLLPDYEEPFLMYDVEPNEYVYGLDRNNNNEPDHREDDPDEDYPYDYDQRGYHLFGQWDLTSHWALAVGRYATEQLAGMGQNESTYALLTYDRQGLQRLRRLFFENHFRRVEDDIPDEYVTLDETPERHLHFNHTGRGLWVWNIPEFAGWDKPPIYSTRFQADPVEYQDSFVNETYLEGRFHPASTLQVVQKARLRLNWQQGGPVHPGIVQRERRLDLWTWVSRMDYTYRWGKLKVVPQYKFMLFRLVDQDADRRPDDTYESRALRFETRSIPLLRLEYPLLARTTLRVGVQGLGPWPYRVEDRVRGAQNFERRTAFVTMTTRSKYFGYELVTIVGLNKDGRVYEDPFQRSRNFDVRSVFVRALIGFTEYGQPI